MSILLCMRFTQSKKNISLARFSIIIYGTKKCLMMKNMHYLELFPVRVGNMLLYIYLLKEYLVNMVEIILLMHPYLCDFKLSLYKLIHFICIVF